MTNLGQILDLNAGPNGSQVSRISEILPAVGCLRARRSLGCELRHALALLVNRRFGSSRYCSLSFGPIQLGASLEPGGQFRQFRSLAPQLMAGSG
jgi:hypothetical protein